MSRRPETRSADTRSVGFLVAGAGNMAAQHMLAAIRQQPPAAGTRDVAGAWVTALFSHNERRARDFAQRHAIIHFAAELEPLLQRSEIQCVYVGNHPRHHAETVLAALSAHKHVLCEPPLALTVQEAEPLVQMAQNRGLVLALNYAWRATGAIHQVAEMLLTDRIGELLGGRVHNTAPLQAEQQTWRLQPNGGGVVWNRTLQDVDLLRFLLRLPLREVYGRSGRSTLTSGVAEEVIGHAVLTGGLAIQLHDSFIQPHAPVTVELLGTHGSLVATHCAPGGGGAELLLRRGEQVERLSPPAINAYRAVVANFLAAVRGDTAALATGTDDLYNIAAANAMQQAMQQSAAIRCQLINP